ncbi:6-carboxytetrahydropterin synthase (plasmid) [Aminobacter sp. SR38]|jgi:6-pyruvoyltetrahydropterin/6-carboxytetrahydropterin synthase|uniref:6-pyruvoyl trahydropterin synthase family protein n=1 Tax=Aminobacter sp. SR38 TaxID=2774562 RepID=UPI00177BB0B9|nr:6-carboxytetrahydropterin synthase [Aminobacter sp. SR38]QOF75043.1 6-carboxytetrahydropterin synthase [Aminobacter sp. SR38]
MFYTSSKTYGHASGLSCAFRQWRAKSHCRFLHGYALAVRIDFEASELDEQGWVVDFGGLRTFKAWLEQTFDHKTLVATDDPLLPSFRDLHEVGAIDLVEVPAVGCEKFARMIFHRAEAWLDENGLAPRCRVSLVEVREHEGNAAIFRPSNSGVAHPRDDQ